MVLYFIGLGLADEKDITVKGLEIVRRAARVYLEAYTSMLIVDKSKLEAFYGRLVIVADRQYVEEQSDEILRDAESQEIAFLVVGDPFGATTHTDLALRCRQHVPPIPTKTIHNASILNAVGDTGLSLYNFGQTVSMVFFTENWKPDSFYDRLIENREIGLHTLILVDIKLKEPNLETLVRTGRMEYERPRFMTSMQCCQQMLEIEALRKRGACHPDNIAVAVARMGTDAQKIVAGTIEELSEYDMGDPLHSVILLGSKATDIEWEYLRPHAICLDTFDHCWYAVTHLPTKTSHKARDADDANNPEESKDSTTIDKTKGSSQADLSGYLNQIERMRISNKIEDKGESSEDEDTGD